jgi:hypothetical protein
VILALLLAAGGVGQCAQTIACSATLRASPGLEGPARAALFFLGLKDLGEVPAPAIAQKTLAGDLAFHFEVERDGDVLLVRALSRHRPPSVYGLARVRPQGVPKEPQKRRAVEMALRTGMVRAMEDLSAQIAEAAGQGRRTIRLSLKVTGLESPARRHAAESLLPCLERQFDALGAVTEAREVSGYLEKDVEYVPAKGEPRDSLQWQVDRLREATLGPRAVCSVPPKLAARFAADRLNRAVLVELGRWP